MPGAPPSQDAGRPHGTVCSSSVLLKQPERANAIASRAMRTEIFWSMGGNGLAEELDNFAVSQPCRSRVGQDVGEILFLIGVENTNLGKGFEVLDEEDF